jgi:ubiquinone/menaquinone biosynthesis C-methylase UbiE
MESVHLTLDAVFDERVGRSQAQFEHFARIYDLPRLQYLQHTCNKTLQYMQKKNGFVIVVLYTVDGWIYASYDGSGRWLPGTSIKKSEDIYDAIERCVNRLGEKIDIRDVQPVLFMDNTFCHNDAAHTMHGIVYAARMRHPENLIDTPQWAIFPLTESFIQWIQKYGNKDILTYVQKHILPTLLVDTDDTQDEEVETNADMKWRYAIHGALCKPLLKLFGLNTNTHIKQRINQQCEWAWSILDVSCGEDAMIYSLAKDTSRLVVGNDISWSQIQLAYNGQENIIFTNHNASQLPFISQSFDVTLCKNTLHHMPHRNHLLSLLDSMKRVAKKIVIVEIEKPKDTGWFAYLLHKYWYRGFLKDVGGAYLDQKQFTSLIHHSFNTTHTIKYWSFTTWQGKYFWAVAEQK